MPYLSASAVVIHYEEALHLYLYLTYVCVCECVCVCVLAIPNVTVANGCFIMAASVL